MTIYLDANQELRHGDTPERKLPKQPTVQQMRVRANWSHRRVLADAADGTQSHGLSNEEIKAYLRAKQTLFRWGCLMNGPMERDENMTTSYPLLLTERGRALLAR